MLHSVNPPAAKGFPVPTLISMFPDSDHFHSWLSAPVKDHISSLFAPAWTTLPVVWTPSQLQSDLMTKARPDCLPNLSRGERADNPRGEVRSINKVAVIAVCQHLLHGGYIVPHPGRLVVSVLFKDGVERLP